MYKRQVHVDAVQAWLRIPIDLKKWKNVDTPVSYTHLGMKSYGACVDLLVEYYYPMAQGE